MLHGYAEYIRDSEPRLLREEFGGVLVWNTGERSGQRLSTGEIDLLVECLSQRADLLDLRIGPGW